VLPEIFQYAFFVRGLISVLLLAPLLGGLSHLVVARRLAFFSAALGQAALTGLTIGIVLGEPLNAAYGGIFGFCFLSALAMVYVRRHSSLPPDTLIGVFLALSLGLGICLLVAVTKRFNIHQVEAVMFGSLLTVTDADLALLLGLGAAIGVVLVLVYNHLLLDSLDPALGRVSGVSSAFIDYLFVMLLTAAIVVSLKVIGALLVEAMVVVPAAAARNLARDPRLPRAEHRAGDDRRRRRLFISSRLLVPSGGAVVLAMSALFFVTLASRACWSMWRGELALEGAAPSALLWDPSLLQQAPTSLSLICAQTHAGSSRADRDRRHCAGARARTAAGEPLGDALAAARTHEAAHRTRSAPASVRRCARGLRIASAARTGRRHWRGAAASLAIAAYSSASASRSP
jgi:zinc transport system permease protein